MAKYKGDKVEDRFEKIYAQGMVGNAEIWLDRETGVQYLFIRNGNAGGLTPLLGADGKPVISDRYDL